MGKLYFHCGIFSNTQDLFIEVLGSLFATGLEMSTIGRNLRVPVEGERHVFSNNDNLFNGMRIAIQQGVLDHNNVVVYFNHIVDGVEQTTSIPFNKDGLADYWPIGFFDQIENDLITMLDWKPIV